MSSSDLRRRAGKGLCLVCWVMCCYSFLVCCDDQSSSLPHASDAQTQGDVAPDSDLQTGTAADVGTDASMVLACEPGAHSVVCPCGETVDNDEQCCEPGSESLWRCRHAGDDDFRYWERASEPFDGACSRLDVRPATCPWR